MQSGADFITDLLQLTKFKSNYKAKVEEDFKENGQRTAWQVQCYLQIGCCTCIAPIDKSSALVSVRFHFSLVALLESIALHKSRQM